MSRNPAAAAFRSPRLAILIAAVLPLLSCEENAPRGILLEIWAEPGTEPPEYLLFSWARDATIVIRDRRIPEDGTLPLTDGPLAKVGIEVARTPEGGPTQRRAVVQGVRAGQVIAEATGIDLPTPMAGWTTVRLVLRHGGAEAAPAPGSTADSGADTVDAGQPLDAPIANSGSGNADAPALDGARDDGAEDADGPRDAPLPDASWTDAASDKTGPVATPGSDAPAPPPPRQEAIVAAGRRGLRMLSRDRGVTWTQPVTVASPVTAEIDGITFGGGLFVAVGERHVFTSRDGVSWQTRRHNLGWLQAVAHGNGRFVAVGGNYVSAWSSDGETWTLGEPVRYGGPDYNVNTVVFHQGFFWATGVNGGQIPGSNPARWSYRLYKTADALRRAPAADGSNPTWTFERELVSGDPGLPSLAVCDGQLRASIDCGPTPFRGFGVWLRAAHPDQIQRSTDGTTFTLAASTGDAIRAFAFGVLP